MIYTVSVSELRSNIALYLDRVTNGAKVVIRDEKKGVNIAQISQAVEFDPNAYEIVLRKVAGVLKSENHPEWDTEEDISRWLRTQRLNDERSF